MSTSESCCSVSSPALTSRVPSFSSVTGSEMAWTRPSIR